MKFPEVNGDKPESKDKWPVPHLQETYSCWKKVHKLVEQGNVLIDGYNLDIATVVALARLVNTTTTLPPTETQSNT